MSKSRSKLIKTKLFSRNQFLALIAVAALAGIYLIVKSFAATGSMTIVPASSSPALGSTFTVEIRVDAGSDTINGAIIPNQVNAVRANLTFPVDKLQFVSFDYTGSSFPLQAGEFASNASGIISMDRALSGGSPPVSGNQSVAKLTFKAIGVGPATIGVADTSVLLRSTDNKDVIVSRVGGTYNITDQTDPTTPTGVTVGVRTMNSIALSWSPSSDNVGVTGYKVYRNGTLVGSPSGTSFTNTSLSPGTSYSYTVTAVDAAGNESPPSAAVTTSTLPDTAPPSQPTSLLMSTRTLNSIGLTWTASTDNVGVSGYRINRNGVQVGTTSSPTYNDTGLAPGTTYTYTVVAVDAAGNASTPSATLNASTLADTTPPTAPSTLKVTSQTLTAVSLSWTGSTDNIGVTGYQVVRNGAVIATTGGTTYSDTAGITVGSTYTYVVKAVDAAGNVSAGSNTVSVSIIKTGDIDGNTKIDIFDLSTLLSNYGKTVAEGGLAAADINKDGFINITDLSILLTNYGK